MWNLQCTYRRVSDINTTQKDKGVCLTNKCRYDHTCFKCFESHPTYKCVKKKSEEGNESITNSNKFKVLEEMLEGFDKDKLELLHSGFESGFKVFYSGNNSRSTLLNPEAVSDKMRTEISKGRIAGTFREKLLVISSSVPL